ncbi:MAG TPA: DUF4199 domain-containing protein [Ohtaekwangia sp.]|uniref:DUF4199 domain-containing protein n=1 Tax=Ohtaekwangia sp. TaxID=2066019 RepID=UPI002F94CD3F
MEETTNLPTVRQVGIRYGLIGGVISIIFFVIMNVAQVDITAWYWKWIGYIITAVLIFLAHKYYKENGNGFMPYGQGIGIGVWIGIISSIISSVFTYIYIKFIDSGFIEAIKEKSIADMEAKGMSDEQIEQAMKFVSMFTTAEAMFIMGIIFGIITAVIIALLVSIFTQKKNPEPTF